MRDGLVKALKSGTSESSVYEAIDKWANSSETKKIEQSLFESGAQSYMLGQLMVKGLQLRMVPLSERGRGRVVALAEDVPDEIAFASMSFEEARDFFSKKHLISDAQLAHLLQVYRSRAGAAGDLLVQTLATRAKAALKSAVAGGDNLKDFQDKIGEAEDALGVTPTSPYYLENIYRTNVAGAYGAGRYEAQRDPDVAGVLTLLQYRTVGDDRVRPEHAAADNAIIRNDGGQLMSYMYPPCGYQCRCVAVAGTRNDFGGQEPITQPPPGFEPDPGFDSHPAPVIGT